MAFNPYQVDLPITEILDEAKSQLAAGNRLIVNAPPGAGKSTILPLVFLGESWLKGNKIILLEPRRLAARSIAYRMAQLLDEPVGQTVGYRIRFETRVSDQTKIEVVTEGILTRMLQSDNALEGVGLVIFDEFHERSLHADLALAFTLEAQQVLRPDLRLLVMSATLNMPELETLLKAPAVVSQGKQYPVAIQYTGETDPFMIPEMAARVILQAFREQTGDILAFFPGEGEIRKCEELLKKDLPQAAIHPLFGQLPQKKQLAAIFPDKQDRRKIVLTTSIAETSLTIEGIKVVVDSGFIRKASFDPGSGLSRLVTLPVTKDTADQRTGRAGRLSPGVCYRMWTPATHTHLQEFSTPELLEADLTSLALELAHWGITDAQELNWLNPPPIGHMHAASELLHELEALEDGKITSHGKQIQQLPCHPRIAHMLLEADEMGLAPLATDIAALIEERDPMPDAGIDLSLRVEALHRFRSENRKGGRMNRIEQVANSYRGLLKTEPDNGIVDPYEVGFVLSMAYPERIASARPGNNAQFQLANGRYAVAGHRDDLSHEPWLAVAHLNARDGLGKIHLAAPLNPKDLAVRVREREVITWDTRKGGLVATKDLSIGSIVLQSKPLTHPDPSAIKAAILEVIGKEGRQLLDFSEEVVQWQLRVLSLRLWNEDTSWPDVSTENLLSTSDKWLEPYLDNVRTPEDLKKINLREVLQHTLAYDKQQLLDSLAPLKIKVPSGSQHPLKYREEGLPPILSVRLQELFGLAETPTINGGKQEVLLDLLSPGFKPVQRTADLRSFWNDAYFEVRKDLKRRYPKHRWPEDPWAVDPGVFKKS
ncbi:MAG: ATP-dependent helicase HrpB [Cyclobacteriaceae bacterium]